MIVCVAQVPLNGIIRQTSDDGVPVVLSEPSGPSAAEYLKIAANLRTVLKLP